jgi:hypothetical protein
MTWNAQDADGVASASLVVDGKSMSQVRGPYTAAAGVNFSGVFGTLSVGTHNYTITVTDKLGNPSQYTGTFNVTGPAIGSVVVVIAQGRMTWNAQDSDGVKSSTLTVDGKAASKIRGPYSSASGVNFSGTFGTMLAGTHNYVITATDKLGNPSQYAGTFNVAALMVDASAAPTDSPELLSDQQLAPIVAEAERRLATANSTQVLGAIADVKVQVADLPSGFLGETTGKTILIDRDAAGYGWFVDPTPTDDSEFVKAPDSDSLAAQKGTPAATRVDLLTTVMHEMGHVLGYDDVSSGGLMNGTLPVGVRRTVAVDQVLATLAPE